MYSRYALNFWSSVCGSSCSGKYETIFGWVFLFEVKDFWIFVLVLSFCGLPSLSTSFLAPSNIFDTSPWAIWSAGSFAADFSSFSFSWSFRLPSWIVRLTSSFIISGISVLSTISIATSASLFGVEFACISDVDILSEWKVTITLPFESTVIVEVSDGLSPPPDFSIKSIITSLGTSIPSLV